MCRSLCAQVSYFATKRSVGTLGEADLMGKNVFFYETGKEFVLEHLMLRLLVSLNLIRFYESILFRCVFTCGLQTLPIISGEPTQLEKRWLSY